MRELETAIAQWRQTLAEQIGHESGVLDELESHLREEVDRLVRAGQTPADALAAAIVKLGAPEALACEFAKSAVWLPIPFVLGGAALLFVAFLWFIADIETDIQGRPVSSLLFAHIGALLVGYILSFAIGALADCYALRRVWRELSFGQTCSWTRAQTWMALSALLFTVAGSLLGAVWSSSTRGQFWSWDPREIGALIAIAWQLTLLWTVWQLPRSGQLRMVLGILGNLVVAFAWYGSADTWGFVLIALTQVPILAAGIAPSGWLRPRPRTT